MCGGAGGSPKVAGSLVSALWCAARNMVKAYLYNSRAASFADRPAVDVMYETDTGRLAGIASRARASGGRRQRPINTRPRFSDAPACAPDDAGADVGPRASMAARVARDGRPLRAYRGDRPRFERGACPFRRPSVLAMPDLPRSPELDRLVDRVCARPRDMHSRVLGCIRNCIREWGAQVCGRGQDRGARGDRRAQVRVRHAARPAGAVEHARGAGAGEVRRHPCAYGFPVCAAHT